MNSKNEQKKKRKIKNPFRYFVYDFVKWTGALPVVIWLRLKCYYENKNAKKKIKGGALLCSNHLGFVDPVILSTKIWYRRLNMVATKNLFDTKTKAWFFRNILCIEIDKENIGVDAFKEIINRLKDNKVVTIFPEGHINHKAKENTMEMDPFKSGVILMAMQAKVPIIPMHIIPREKWWHRQKLIVGEPIYLPDERMNLMQIQEYSEKLRNKELELLEVYNLRRKK